MAENEGQSGSREKQPERKFSREQYDMLVECSKEGEKGIKKWNQWRKENPDEDISLDEANLRGAYLKKVHLENAFLSGAYLKNADLWDAHLEGAILWKAHMEKADCGYAHLEKACFFEAHLENANLDGAYLRGADFSDAFLQGTNCRKAIVDGETLLWGCKVNKRGIREKNYTDFAGVGLVQHVYSHK
ncbi:MAG: pentapeptide repeat-containing protein [Phycisphaerales bacterium]|jgi:uncharacterized protein YjbI with pentapeptide repeats